MALEILWSLAKEAELNLAELLLAQTRRGQTAFHFAIYQFYAVGNRVELLQKMCSWAEEAQPNSNELKNKLLLAKDKYGYTVWHGAAASGNLEVLKMLWSWAKETELYPEKLLLAQSNRGETAWYFAAKGNHLDVLQKLCVWAEEAQLNPNDLQRAERFGRLKAFWRRLRK